MNEQLDSSSTITLHLRGSALLVQHGMSKVT